MWLRRLDRRQRLWIAPSQWAEIREAVGLTQAACDQAAWAITPNGEKRRGAGAVNTALDALIGWGGCDWLYRRPGIRPLQDAIYQWIADHRGRLPGVTPALAQPGGWRPQHRR